MTAMLGNRRQLFSCEHEQAGDEDRLGDLAFFVRGGLERLAGRIGEAVQVEAVVPVGATDQRQTMRPKAVERVLEAALQVLVERLLGARLIVVRHRLVEDAPVARLLEIGRHADDQPVRIVVEVAANVVVAALGERLVLVIRAAGRQLRRGQVEDAFARARRHHVHEAQQVLVGIAEAQSAPDARFIERRRARHVERRHALVRVPDVDHAIGVDVGRLHLADAEQFVPVRAQALEGGVNVGGLQILRDDRLHCLLVDGLRIRRIELLRDRILVIAKHEDDLLRSRPGLRSSFT